MNDLKIHVDKIYYNHLETIYNTSYTREAYKESYGKEWLHFFRQSKEYINLMTKLKTYNEELEGLYQAVIRQIINKYSADIPHSCNTKFQKIQHLFKTSNIKLDDIEDVIVNLIVNL
jgi:hypothetical protein